MKPRKLTTDLAIAAMLFGMAGLVANIFGVWRYIYVLSVSGSPAGMEADAGIRNIYVFMNIPLKIALIVSAIALLYRLGWGRWSMTVVGVVSIVHSIVATTTLKSGVIHYWLSLGAGDTTFHPLAKAWDYMVLVLVVLFYTFLLWHLHCRDTRAEFRLAAGEPIEWTRREGS
jgi:hypothetical protein